MNLLNKILVFYLFAFNALAVKPIFKTSNSSRTIKAYLKKEKQFLKKLCPGGTEEKYNKLYKKYKGAGYYVPIISSDKLDNKTILKFLPVLSKKIAWINNEINYFLCYKILMPLSRCIYAIKS